LVFGTRRPGLTWTPVPQGERRGSGGQPGAGRRHVNRNPRHFRDPGRASAGDTAG